MKKPIIALWCLLLAGVLAFLIVGKRSPMRNYINVQKHQKFREAAKEKKRDIFSINKLDSLLTHNEYVLLSVGSGGCGACDYLISSPIPGEFGLPHYFIDRELHPANRLVAQSLFNVGSPESYIIDRGRNVVGVIVNNTNFRNGLDDIINKGSRGYYGNSQITGDENTLAALSSSFRGMIAYLQKDWDAVRENGLASLRSGEFPFNNYLLHRYHRQWENADSAQFYKVKTLASATNGRDVHVYETIIRELDPTNEKLKWVAR